MLAKSKQFLFLNIISQTPATGSRYANLNLNQTQKPCVPFISTQSKTHKHSDATVSDDINGKQKLQFGTKDLRTSNLAIVNGGGEKEEKKCSKNDSKLNTTKNSTLSLHIEAYENAAAGSFCDKNSDGSKSKTTKQIFISSTFFIQNPFEFPRQQNDDEVTAPEVSQYSASQRLLNPNEASTNGQQSVTQPSAPLQLLAPSVSGPPCANVSSGDNDGVIVASNVIRWPCLTYLASTKKPYLFAFVDGDRCWLFNVKDDKRATCENSACTSHWRYSDKFFLDNPVDRHHLSCQPQPKAFVEKRQLERAFLLSIQGQHGKSVAEHFEKFKILFHHKFGHVFPDQQHIIFKRNIRRTTEKELPSPEDLAAISDYFSDECEVAEALGGDFDDQNGDGTIERDVTAVDEAPPAQENLNIARVNETLHHPQPEPILQQHQDEQQQQQHQDDQHQQQDEQQQQQHQETDGHPNEMQQQEQPPNPLMQSHPVQQQQQHHVESHPQQMQQQQQPPTPNPLLQPHLQQQQQRRDRRQSRLEQRPYSPPVSQRPPHPDDYTWTRNFRRERLPSLSPAEEPEDWDPFED